MRIACVGGGPAGLVFAISMKLRDPRHDIVVFERNDPGDTFGWGVVFSDATMDTMRRWDRETADAIEAAFAHWDDIELRFKGRRIRSGGHGFVGIGRGEGFTEREGFGRRPMRAQMLEPRMRLFDRGLMPRRNPP